jgi:LAO/AO transport system kinase
MDIIRLADMTVMVLAPGFGDDVQAMKAGILEVADLLVINKDDQPGADKLALDLGTVFTDADDRDLRLLRTVASEDRGLDMVLDRIMLLAKQFRQDNTLQKRRQHSFALETMDWAMEMLRPKISGLIAPDGKTDPRLAAQEIVKKLGQESSQ